MDQDGSGWVGLWGGGSVSRRRGEVDVHGWMEGRGMSGWWRACADRRARNAPETAGATPGTGQEQARNQAGRMGGVRASVAHDPQGATCAHAGSRAAAARPQRPPSRTFLPFTTSSQSSSGGARWRTAGHRGWSGGPIFISSRPEPIPIPPNPMATLWRYSPTAK
ncbi:hypothetical protein ANO11243_046280 [Dothideomycetidae sp. 11243]|nr:hypothetical protein ANO11243_046280 [fungal sp. No.11243]